MAWRTLITGPQQLRWTRRLRLSRLDYLRMDATFCTSHATCRPSPELVCIQRHPLAMTNVPAQTISASNPIISSNGANSLAAITSRSGTTSVPTFQPRALQP
jgi:hypothetical protein